MLPIVLEAAWGILEHFGYPERKKLVLQYRAKNGHSGLMYRLLETWVENLTVINVYNRSERLIPIML